MRMIIIFVAAKISLDQSGSDWIWLDQIRSDWIRLDIKKSMTPLYMVLMRMIIIFVAAKRWLQTNVFVCPPCAKTRQGQTRPDRQLSKASQILRDKSTGLEGHSSCRYYSNLAYHVDSKVHSVHNCSAGRMSENLWGQIQPFWEDQKNLKKNLPILLSVNCEID